MTTEQKFEPTQVDCKTAWKFGLDYFGRYVMNVPTEEVKSENEELWWGTISHMVSYSDPICAQINVVLHMDKYLNAEQMRQYFGRRMLEIQKTISERTSSSQLEMENQE